MEINIRIIGKTIVEMTCKESGAVITTDIANNDGLVCTEFIENLESITEDIRNHNASVLLDMFN